MNRLNLKAKWNWIALSTRCWLSAQKSTKVKAGVWPLEDNPLVNAPHIQNELVAEWAHPYSREVAVFPAGVADKYWPTVKRLDDVYGDRNLFCSCVPISEYQ